MMEQENDQTQESKATSTPQGNDKALQIMKEKHEKRKRVAGPQYETALNTLIEEIETNSPHTPASLTKQLRKTSHELRKSNEEIDKLLRESNETIDELIDETAEPVDDAAQLLYGFNADLTENEFTEQEKNKENIPPKQLNANPKNTMC